MTAAYLRAPGFSAPQALVESLCLGKQRFGSEAEARRAVWRMGTTSQPYRCHECQTWHLGQVTAWRRRHPQAAR